MNDIKQEMWTRYKEAAEIWNQQHECAKRQLRFEVKNSESGEPRYIQVFYRDPDGCTLTGNISVHQLQVQPSRSSSTYQKNMLTYPCYILNAIVIREMLTEISNYEDDE